MSNNDNDNSNNTRKRKNIGEGLSDKPHTTGEEAITPCFSKEQLDMAGKKTGASLADVVNNQA